jgi:hypothetical protein
MNLEESLARVEELSSGGPSPTCIRRTQYVLEDLAKEGHSPDKIVLSAQSGISLIFLVEALELEVSNNGFVSSKKMVVKYP